MRVNDWLRSAEQRLHTISESPRLDAELLLADVLDVNRTRFRSHPEHEIPTQSLPRANQALERRALGEPVAYITGRQAFWTLELHVNASVLVPRPETELLVELALAHLHTDACTRALDVGTGSGAIALAIASERPRCQVVATDLSPAALQCARSNASAHQLAVDLVEGHLFASTEGPFDVVVSNPPYIAADDTHVAPHVRQFEPSIALFAADDGLAVLRSLIVQAPSYLAEHGWLILEHGWQQGEQVRELLVKQGFSHVRSHADLAGHERVTEAQWLSQVRVQTCDV